MANNHELTTPLPENVFPANLDVAELLATGWRPSPFRQFILKVHSRCDLACPGCYVYEMADQGWRAQPRQMSPDIVKHTAFRIAEHARTHRLADIDVILHGGEPLLAGPESLAHIVRTIRGECSATGTRVRVSMQTNGVRLNETYLRLFDELDIRIGVSLDGTAAAHDRTRLFANGRGSHRQVSRALRSLTDGPFHHLFAGILCTIDLRNNPLETYHALLEFDPPSVDFLLPHGNWSAPPPEREPHSPATPYADWLIEIFDEWREAVTFRTEIRLFHEILRLLSGFPSRTEAVGLSPSLMVVVETNGDIEQSDILKSAYDRASATGLHVRTDPFDAALENPAIVARQIGAAALGPECTACDLMEVCGGGLYAHRFRPGAGFLGPSVYCPDLYRLISYISDRHARDTARLKGRV
ncbi:FxsB family cyclophane-forming radical SAM/SPASM peptide maturase [Herbidospora sp. NBRC 101105]|uniref:FxsB family cyclophane-forming radical SAM/SPASM peptide maturase n=1 Tax=Herbidospora sp. NBRC 101105 TaxID=3032195 RepID=UPI0024A51EDD|nr:FxsB family cyclophane-forming radical SAM/SPASM peptide maturase [Herbidospora sp. NBRC 101105]GLX95809.1 radical SAM protein [Herbidospora sp. NBRC 101105]